MEKREKSSRIIVFIVFIPFLIFILLQFLAPISLPQGSVNDLSGMTAITDNENIIDDMSAPWNFVYGAGDRLCHQISERSFFINENQMPFCARCTAIFLGITIGIGIMIFIKIKLDYKFIFLIFAGLIPIAIDGLGQHFELWESTNISRLITGLLIGIITGITISIIIDEFYEMFDTRKNRKIIN